MILRTQYLERIRPFYDSELIKVITGMRFSTDCIAPSCSEASFEKPSQR